LKRGLPGKGGRKTGDGCFYVSLDVKCLFFRASRTKSAIYIQNYSI
jgi:hypothetical protein